MKNVIIYLKFWVNVEILGLEFFFFFNILNTPDRWLIALYVFKEESPGSTKTQCQLTAGGGNPRDIATENKPPYQGKGEKVW